MFKPLLRTLPSLSGNFTIACKLREIDKENNNDYSTYIRLANIIPLQNFIANKNIELNLLNGKYEHDITKYFYYHSNVFYKENFTYNKNNYKMLDLDSLYNNYNDTRNKDYEFGCKRIQYSQHKSQFNFYAPIYIDNVNDLPEYFCIHIIFNDHLVKNIKIYINKYNKRNYLKNYLTHYLKQIDDRVIFCLPESLQATYFGIDVKNGGIVQYKDNAVGYIYNNQTTINNFDWTICQGFERNNLIMRQIIPLSFSFNLNDILNEYEQETFAGAKIKISGFYYSKNDINYDLFDFDINYINMYQKYNKYNEKTGKYEFKTGNVYGKNINIMNIGFPSLNEAKYVKYLYTNKITPKYCKFKMNLSSDNNPYITNLSFGYSYIQYPNQKYGYFPTMFKGINVEGVLIDGDLKLPIGNGLEKYYKTVKYLGNKLYLNTINSDKHIKLMTNYCSSWFNINNYNVDFNDPLFINKTFNNINYWTNVKYNYAYFKGILYDLNGIEKYNVDKFGVFLDVKMKHYTQEEVNNNFVNAKYVFSSSEKSITKIYQFNDLYNMLIIDEKTGIKYYNKLFDVFNNSMTYNDSISTKYLCTDKNMILDERGKFVEEKHYIEENTYYKLDDIKSKLMKFVNGNKHNDIISKIEEFQINGYLLLDANHNINYFEEYVDKKETRKRFILENKDYVKLDKYKQRFEWLYYDLYYSTVSNILKTQVGEHDTYDKLGYNEAIDDKFCMFIKTAFVHKTDIINILLDYDNENALAYLNNIESYIYEHVGVVNGIDISNYFIKNENLDLLDVFVDPYNLDKYIDLYNKDHINKLSKKLSKPKEFYFKAIDKDHILEYFDNLYKDEFKNTEFSYASNEVYHNKYLNTKSNVLDNIFVKERCWIIENKIMKPIDRYISLYEFLKRYNEKLIVYMHTFFKNEDLLNWLLNNISDTRSYNNNFSFKFQIENGGTDPDYSRNLVDINIEMNLCFKKKMVMLNKTLYTLLKNNHFLYLYIPSKDIDNINIWNIISNSDINNNTSLYVYKDINDYLIPLFNGPYLNDNDCTTVFNMVNYQKINSKYKYVLNNSTYFKEIDVDTEILNICYKDKLFIENWLHIVRDYEITNKNLYTIDNLDDLINNWNIYCINNDFDMFQLEEELNDKEYKMYVKFILNFLKEYNDGNIYYQLIKNCGIILYSIIYNNEIDLHNIIIDNENLIYDEENKLYIYTNKNTNKKYAFYWVSLDINNTNNSFYIQNDYNFNVVFDSINNISIYSNKFNKYLNKIFYILYPLLKLNIFNEYSKLNKNIIYPYESEIKISHIQSLLNNNEHNKYSILKDSSDDLLYGEIVKIIDKKKVKLLRYFNYISPYLKNTNIINDSYSLRFINIDNPYKHIKKYNIFDKEDLNIYKYNGINLYNGTYDKNIHQFTNHTIISQYEYKHFEDNILFNLPEYINLKDKKYYTYDEIKIIENNEEEIKNKKLNILLKFFNKKGYDYNDIILFLFNKYDSNMIIERVNTKCSISEKLYKISYKFNLI